MTTDSLFKLSAEITAHDQDVRALCLVDSNTFASASRDKLIHIWQLNSQSPVKYERIGTLAGHTNFVSSLALLNENVLLSGGMDKSVKMWNWKTGELLKELKDHQDNVCAMAVSANQSMFVTSSWDKTARVYSADGKFVAELKGHSMAVWSCIFLSNDDIVTASADKSIRLWKGFKCVKVIENAHNDVVRSLELFKGDLYSCSNDASLCRWDLSSGSGADLVKKDTLYGHQSFMYCLSGSDKFIASSSEDKTVRVWDGKNCFQVIRIPATSIWCCLFLKNGDICAGSNDGKIRVFTQAADRTAQLTILQKYEEALDAMTINEKELGQQINKEKLPFVEDLLAESGKKEGEVRMAKSSDGGVDAYQWSTGQWIKIGQVVSAVGSGQKKMHEGKEYDYVFDVDIQEGAPPLKLCYNTGMNPFAAAQEFIYQYELPQTYLDQIANFIITNANVPATIGEGSSGYSDPYTGASRYVPSGATQTTTVKQDYVSSIFPSGPQSYLAFKGINLDAVQKKISQLFEATPEILSTSDKIISRLKENKEDKQITAGLVSLITKSAQDLRFPFIDLLRFACSLGYEIVENDMTVLTQLLREESNQINLVLLLRLVCNVFEHDNGRYLMDTFFEPINEAMLNNSLLNRIFAGQVEANGSIKNVQLAYVTFFMNSTVFLCHHEKAGSSSSNTSKDQINSRSLALLMMILNSTAAAGVDEECYYRVAVGIGNLLTLKNPELKDLLKQSQIIEKFPSSSDRIANLVNELTKLTS